MNNDSSSKISEKDKRILFLLNKYNARMHIINCIYQSELFNKNLSIQEILENCGENQLNANEIESLKIIEAKYDVFTRIAKKFISED